MCLQFDHPGGSPFQCPSVSITALPVEGTGTVLYNFLVTLNNTGADDTTATLTVWYGTGARLTASNTSAVFTLPGSGNCGNGTNVVGPLAVPANGQAPFTFSWRPDPVIDADTYVFIQAQDLSNPGAPDWFVASPLNAESQVPS